MKKIVLVFCAIVLLLGCESAEGVTDGDYDGSVLSSEASGDASGSDTPDFGNGDNGKTPGQITAAEWNDLSQWAFWSDLLNTQDYTEHHKSWDFNTSKRIAIQILDKNTSEALNNISVSLYKGNELICAVKTDNFGKANLFIDLFDSSKTSTTVNLSEYKIEINGEFQTEAITLLKHGVNVFNIEKTVPLDKKIELAFIVDATGSMGDELEFLKSDLTNVISRVQTDNENASILTSTVFYRDYGDDYVTKRFDFTTNISSTVNFIKGQSASGGGDFEEAVEVALDETINDLQWSANATTKIAFLLLDAPPHLTNETIESIHKSVYTAAEKGIKIIPVTASGITKSTEFLMRYLSIATNGTYVFITNDSGIGNDHLEPTVGEYEVEYLNDLMVRLINKYAE
ncbi:hypothetical protein ACFFU1_11385 [Algibacter miyuki]|uniref:VWFA domain-containing protein n=1 Tax=Algibacter miyuki TaxID=1306933 RepID=A0ABV5H202_9FLAO|nr:hypothetical protein [Algibacter miyuki]MDN3664097.1 hypothetical protein [Algibacter miyuki]